MTELAKVQEALDFINERVKDFKPRVGIILGTGLGGLVEEIEESHSLLYGLIPHFPVSTVESHEGRLIFGSLNGVPVVAMQGRFHYYEGYNMKQVIFPVRVLKFLGIESLLVSNAAGSLKESIHAGDLMVVRDHIFLQPESPFRGEHHPEFGSRFPDPIESYNPDMRARALDFCQEQGISCHEGVYVSVPGPHLETPAEYDYLHRIGGDAVGMSTVPEVLAAGQMGLPCFAVSVITDQGYPPERVKPVTIEEVVAVAAKAEPGMTRLIKHLISSS
jgi:purine-nucleoside phosphorylase